MQINHAMALLLGGLACATDLRTRRIPNLPTFGGAALAFVYALATHGFGGLLTSLEGWAVGLAILPADVSAWWHGAGDVKLLACLGALGGPLGRSGWRDTDGCRRGHGHCRRLGDPGYARGRE